MVGRAGGARQARAQRPKIRLHPPLAGPDRAWSPRPRKCNSALCLTRRLSTQLPVKQQQQRVDAPNQCDSHDEEGRSELEQLRLERRDENLPAWGCHLR